MKKMMIFEPAMCCSTGVCGPSVDPELLRVATTINSLKSQGIPVERYNLSGNPQAFVDCKEINNLLNQQGIEVLPVTMVEGIVVKTKAYPTEEEFNHFLGIRSAVHNKVKIKMQSKGCGCKDGCC